MEIRFPFRFVSGAVLTQSDSNALATQHLYAMLATWEGERVMMPNYGGPFRRALFDPAEDTTFAYLSRLIQDASAAWNSDLVITSIQRSALSEEEYRENSIALDISYRVQRTGVSATTTVRTDGASLLEVLA